ncbi:MAG: hypothetical protein R3F43_01695 [bacterium]
MVPTSPSKAPSRSAATSTGPAVTVEPGLQAAFVDYGAERNGSTTFNDINERFYNRTFTGKGRPRIQDAGAWRRAAGAGLQGRGGQTRAPP